MGEIELDDGQTATAPFPARLLEWAGHRSGGVRRLFDKHSGRPGQTVFRTNLLTRLEAWTSAIARGDGGTPRILLLVGGPGNGKTEAIETTVRWLDDALFAGGRLVGQLSVSFFPEEGSAVPRLVRVDAGVLANPPCALGLSIVQDASVVPGMGGRSAAQLLLDELGSALAGPASEVYLCCVNRGVLDDGLIEAMDVDDTDGQAILEAVTRAVSLSPDAPSCWPLDGNEAIAVCPMDAKSLFVGTDDGGDPPARELFLRAIEPTAWPAMGACEAGSSCPFCHSRSLLGHGRELGSLLAMLRWYEVGSGKRWSFRDLFSLTSYLLAGHRTSGIDAEASPCSWAASQMRIDEPARRGARPAKDSSTAIFRLVASQYQHALFHRWDREAGPSLLRDIKELGLAEDNTAMGLYWFLASRRSAYLPATIGPLLDGVVELLDPAMASPDTQIQTSQKTSYLLRDLDIRFSRSVSDGLDHVRKSRILSGLEVDLMERLARLDVQLSVSALRKKRPAAASRVQRLVRDFACRLTRRSIGARVAIVTDGPILADFQRVVEDEQGDDLYDVAREVERLLNSKQDFEISLTTTFGQPLPPLMRRATLVVPARQVQPRANVVFGRPRSPISFFQVGSGQSSQPIALTYDLFKAVKELERGMSVASLPRSVLALLDTTRARLSGPIVRDRDILDRARIRLGTGGIEVEQRRAGFSARKEFPGR